MTEPSSGPVLFISNGHGEDSIAAGIIGRLPPGRAEAFPLLGTGTAYRAVCPVIGPRSHVPSGGSRVERGSLVRDIGAGALGAILPAIRFIRAIKPRYRRIVIVGDMVGIYLAAAAGITGAIYVDVYKTGYGRSYGALDLAMLRRTSSKVFSRHESLATKLRAARLDAVAAGNPMLDTVPHSEYDAGSRRAHALGLALLPGSRADTAANLAMQVDALRALRADMMPDLFAAIAPSVDPLQLARAADLHYRGPMTGEAADAGMLLGRGIAIHLATGAAMGEVIAASDIVLSQAGTGTVQALGLGKPVITARRRRERQSRLRAETALFGEGRILVQPDPDSLVAGINRLLANPIERERRGAIGRARVGQPGAVDAIVAAILG